MTVESVEVVIKNPNYKFRFSFVLCVYFTHCYGANFWGYVWQYRPLFFRHRNGSLTCIIQVVKVTGFGYPRHIHWTTSEKMGVVVT